MAEFKKIIAVCFLFFLFPSVCRASDKFEISNRITYTVMNNGKTKVTEQISLRNKTSDFYPSMQTLSYSGISLGNFQIIDAKGEYEPEVETKDNLTTVTVKIREQNVGLGAVTKFTLAYETLDLVSQENTVWQIIIPGFKNNQTVDNLTLELKLPSDFPEAQYVSLEPKTKWVWDGKELRGRGVILIFGQEQFYRVKLNYAINNPDLSPVYSSIPVPPETAYQKVAIESLSKNPSFAEEDPDGNWLFWYELAGRQSMKITVNFLVKLVFNPEGKKVILSNLEKKTYTSSQEFWDYKSWQESKDKTLLTKRSVKEIYDFVISRLTYDFGRLAKPPKRYTASEILTKPENAICTDFTNLFIALARQNGIAAREVDGYAFSENQKIQPASREKDILHAWPEFYDENRKIWIMVDPTWEKTTGGVDYFNKLDLNHITFVKKGISSVKPLSPGNYKIDDFKSKDIDVSFVSKEEFNHALNSSTAVDVIIDIPEILVSGFANSGKIIIKNISKKPVENIPVEVKFINLKSDNWQKNISRLIPFQQYEIPLQFQSVNFWEKTDGQIEVTVGQKMITKKISYIPVFLLKDNLLLFIIVIFCLTILAILILKIIFSQKKT